MSRTYKKAVSLMRDQIEVLRSYSGLIVTDQILTARIPKARISTVFPDVSVEELNPSRKQLMTARECGDLIKGVTVDAPERI